MEEDERTQNRRLELDWLPPPLKWGVAILLKCTLKSSQINYNAAALLLVTNSVVDKI